MKVYKKNIAFTKTPLSGQYQFKDYFKIYPFTTANGPKNKSAKHFPCIIELTYEEDDVKGVKPFDLFHVDKMISETTTQTNKLIEITNLLSAITNYRFFFYRNMEMFWSIPLLEKRKEEMDHLTSDWSFSLFYYPDLAKDFEMGKSFSETKFPPIKLTERRRYYFYNPVESTEKEIDFPIDIDLVLTNYLGLTADEKLVCDSAIFTLCNGLDLSDKMKSLSFISVVSSIETLAHHEFKNEIVEYECNDCKTLKSSSRNCSTCGRPIWGITAKFREFLFKYVSEEKEARKMYNKIYTIRSKISHTDYLVNGENFLNWDFSDETDEIAKKHIEAVQLSRRAMSSWLGQRTNLK